MTDWNTDSKIVDEINGGGNVKMLDGSIQEIIDGLSNGLLKRETLEKSIYYLFNSLSYTISIKNLIYK